MKNDNRKWIDENLETLSMLVDKVAHVHGPNHPELLEVKSAFDRAVPMLDEETPPVKELASLKSLTADFVPPEDACRSYRAMLAGLAELHARLS